MSPSTITSNPPMVKDPLEALTADQKILLEKIVLYQDEFELPNEEDVKRVSVVIIYIISIYDYRYIKYYLKCKTIYIPLMHIYIYIYIYICNYYNIYFIFYSDNNSDIIK